MMNQLTPPTGKDKMHKQTCPHCGADTPAESLVCPTCQAPLNGHLPATTYLTRAPRNLPGRSRDPAPLRDDQTVVLQVLPSGVCVTLKLDQPVTLGRDPHQNTDTLLDLTPYHAERHGVSRVHCRLERTNGYLIITDLDSTNGTSLNGQRLDPFQPCRAASGDKLLLGSLHMNIFFETLTPTSNL